jgi:hypothetical protein
MAHVAMFIDSEPSVCSLSDISAACVIATALEGFEMTAAT